MDPKLLLIASRALAAMRPALIAFLISRAAELSDGIKMPISFCNILFVGNFCAALVVLARFGWHPIVSDLKSLSRKVWFGLFLKGCLAVLLSTSIYLGLQSTTVTNAILIGRAGPVLYAILGATLLRRSLAPQEWFGYASILVGIFSLTLRANNYQIQSGDWLILASAVVYATSALVTKLLLSGEANLRIVVFSNNLFASLVFFAIAVRLFGLHHFADLVSGRLWIIMSVYALLIVVLAQFMWFSALARLDSRTVGRLAIFSPIFGVLYAYVLNGERPSEVQITAFAIVAAGTVVASLGKSGTHERARTSEEVASESEPAISTN